LKQEAALLYTHEGSRAAEDDGGVFYAGQRVVLTRSQKVGRSELIAAGSCGTIADFNRSGGIFVAWVDLDARNRRGEVVKGRVSLAWLTPAAAERAPAFGV
jgi:hypothetical protein